MISEPVRHQALAFVESARDDPERLNRTARAAVVSQGRSSALYRQALYAAEVACRALPENANYLNTLGVAQYRVSRYAEAANTLRRSLALNMTQGRRAFLEDLGGVLMSPWTAAGTRFWASAHPADVAVLALAHARLRHVDEARAYRAWLAYLIQQAWWAQDDEARAFWREVEAVVPTGETAARK
jgi:hypothetical protein